MGRQPNASARRGLHQAATGFCKAGAAAAACPADFMRHGCRLTAMHSRRGARSFAVVSRPASDRASCQRALASGSLDCPAHCMLRDERLEANRRAYAQQGWRARTRRSGGLSASRERRVREDLRGLQGRSTRGTVHRRAPLRRQARGPASEALTAARMGFARSGPSARGCCPRYRRTRQLPSSQRTARALPSLQATVYVSEPGPLATKTA